MIKTNRRTFLGASVASLASGLALANGACAAEPAPGTVPTTPMPSVDSFARPPLVDRIALSPDGTRVAFVTQAGDDKLLRHFSLTDMKPQTINMGPDKVRDLIWGDNSHVVLVNSMSAALAEYGQNRHEFNVGRIMDLDSLDVRILFKDVEGFYGIILGDVHRVTTDGEYKVVAGNYRTSGGGQAYQVASENKFYLYSFSLNSKAVHQIAECSNATNACVVGPDGQPIAYSDFDQFNKEWSLYFNRSAGGKMPAFQRVYVEKYPGVTFPSLEGLGRDGNSVVVSFPVDDNFNYDYHEVSADGVVGPALDTDGDFKEHGLLFHPTTLRLAGFSRHGDTVSRDYFDPLMQKLESALPQALGDDYRSISVSSSDDPRKLIAYSEGKGDAGGYYFIDFATGQATSIAANYPGISEEWVTQKQAIDYKAADGLDIHAYLTLPPFPKGGVNKNLPLIVLPHGGPQSRDTIDFDWQAQIFASRGYAVLQPNFRGSTGYGGDFVTAGHGEWGRKMQTDLSDGVRYLAGEGLVDPARVAIFGASYGGYAALAGATLDAGVYRCAVSIAGPSDLAAFVESVTYDTDKWSIGVRYWKQFMGNPGQYDQISPAKQASHAYCPILLIHGTDDTVVPIDQSQRMESALKAAGKPVDFVTFKGQDHWETIPSARISMMQAGVDFIMKHNPV